VNLPRGECVKCGVTVALRNNGVTREHRRPGFVAGRKLVGVCSGSGLPPKKEGTLPIDDEEE
jgi:hypothetical protein